jgi:eukaryotic-like serine/threonine-protein kinase
MGCRTSLDVRADAAAHLSAHPIPTAMNQEGQNDRVGLQDILGRLSALDVSERHALLHEVSGGDPDFADRVKQILDNYDSALEFFQKFPGLLRDASEKTPARTFSDGEIVADRFRIRCLRGQGGVGEVYEAEDRDLDGELVALKTLRASLAGDERLVDRLTQELRLARRISHPNVCRVFDVYQHHTTSRARISFFTMELLAGETLANRLQRGRITTDEALPLVQQMAEAIDAAHAADVVHGDLKPANIMLVPSPSGAERVVVTDFGLARWLPVASTLVSTTLDSRPWGTPVYMAPEQLLGARITRASDIYALGVVCYEMVTGQQPFTLDSPLLLAVRKLRQAPLPPREVVPELDVRWQAAILRCLDVDPEHRFPFARDIVKAIERGPTGRRSWMIGSAAAVAASVIGVTWGGPTLIEGGKALSTLVARQVNPEQTVVILPFSQEYPSGEGNAFALGLTAAVTDALGSVARESRGLYVIPTTEVIDTGVNTPPLAQQTLGATLFVSARVATVNDHTEIAIGLNELSRQGFRLKDTRMVTIPSNGRAVLEPVTAAIMQLLDMNGSVGASPWDAGEALRLEAETAYLLGRGYLAQGTTNLAAAIRALQSSIQQHDQYAPAHASLGEAYLAQYVATRDASALSRAQGSVDRAIAIEPNDPRSRVIRGRIYLATSQNQRAILELKSALDLDPDAPDARRRLGQAYEADGAIDKAEETYREAIGRHPRHWSAHEDLAVFLYGEGRYREAEQSFVAASAYAPANLLAIRNLAAVYLVQERFEAAESELEKGLSIAPDAALYNNLAWVYILEGKFRDAVTPMEEAVKLSGADSNTWSSLARTYRWATGHEHEAQRAYETALQQADEEKRVNPLNAEVRGNRAYLLAEMGRTDEALREMASTLALDNAKAQVIVLFDAALVHELIGDRKQALEHLLLAARGGYSKAVIERHPDLRRLRTDPGFRQILDVAEQQAAQRFK